MRFIAAGLLLLVSLTASAAPLDITFEWPTTHVDGTPIPTSGPGKIVSARFQYGTCVGADLDQFGVSRGEVTVSYPATSIHVDDVGTGIVCVRGYAKNDLGVESGPSNLGRYFPAPAPLVLKTTTKTAYELRPSADKFAFVAVGTVPLGAKCGKQLVKPYAEVMGAKITKPLKGGVIAGKCA